VNIVFETKTDSNPENTVGVMTMAGKGPEVLVTHTKELGQIIQAVHSANGKISGTVDLPTAINVAQLALKHRQNKNLRQRIVAFLGSPLEGNGIDEKSLTKLAKKLKKNNIAIDIVCFGDGIEEGDASLLKTFVDGINSGDNSHLVAAPADPRHLLSDIVLSSSVLATDRGVRDEAMADITNAAGPSGVGGGFDELGVDPSIDPELAMALRMSLEEDLARRAAQESAAGAAAEPVTQAPVSEPAAAQLQPAQAPPVAAHVPTTSAMDLIDADEEAQLQQALALSQMPGKTDAPSTTADADVPMDEDLDEEEMIRRAIEMSKGEEEEEK